MPEQLKVQKLKENEYEELPFGTPVYLECIAMPNGELLCSGGRIELHGDHVPCDRCNNGDIDNCAELCKEENGSIQCDGDAMIEKNWTFAAKRLEKYLYKEVKENK
jgi:hypothetical protein